jgi:hypothetical protein
MSSQVVPVERRSRPGHGPESQLPSGSGLLVIAALILATMVYLGALGPWFLTSRSASDVGIVVGSADRMLHGQVPYRDFFLFIGIVGPLVTVAWFLLFGSGALSMIALCVAVGVATVLGTYWAARALVPAPWAAAAAFVPLFVGPLFWFTLSHHWFATLFMVLATASTLRIGSGPALNWALLAGACCGLAGLSHQGRGFLALVGVLAVVVLVREPAWRWRRVAAVLCGCGVVALTVLGPIALLVGLQTLVYSLVWFVVAEYPKANQVPYLAFDLVPTGFSVSGVFGALQAVLGFALLAIAPLGVVLLALRATAMRSLDLTRARQCASLALLGLVAWLGVLYQPSAIHIGYVAPWFAVAWAALLQDASSSPRGAFRRTARLTAAVLSVCGLAFLPLPQILTLAGGGIVWVHTPTGPAPLGTPTDAALYSGSFIEVSEFVLAHTSASDGVVFFPARSVNNVLLQRPNPIRFDLVAAGENTDAQLAEVRNDLTVAHRAAYVVLETDVAERIVERGVTDERFHQGRQLMAALRETLPQVYVTPSSVILLGQP